jgi:hypothetical protein
MGLDTLAATVQNDTDPANGVWLLILNGDLPDSLWPPKPEDYGWAQGGQNSSWAFRSIDAFAAYNSDGTPLSVMFHGKSSSWWKIPDGLTTVVKQDSDGNLWLFVTDHAIFCNHNPEPSSAADWQMTWHVAPPANFPSQ